MNASWDTVLLRAVTDGLTDDGRIWFIVISLHCLRPIRDAALLRTAPGTITVDGRIWFFM